MKGRFLGKVSQPSFYNAILEGAMRITKYRTELDENKHNILIKESATNYCTDNFTDPRTISNMLNECFGLNRLAEEHAYLIALSTKCKPLGVFEVSHGTVNLSIINPREIFIRLLLVGASSFVLVHNHPSGDCTPSEDDIRSTRRIKKCTDIMGIPLIDHIIVGDGYNSFYQNGLLG